MSLAQKPKGRDVDKRLQLDTQQEQELSKYSGQYKVLAAQCSHSLETKAPRLKKAIRVTRIFQNEYQNLLTDLEVATAKGKIRNDAVQFSQLNRLLQEYDIYNEDVHDEKQYIAEVENQIREVSKRVQQLRKAQTVGEDDYVAQRRHDCSVLETLENKLENKMITFNKIVTKNVELRQQIDLLLNDRNNFVLAFEKLIDKIGNGKYIMLDLIEQATLAYDKREEWCDKLQILRMRAYKDHSTNMDDIKHYRQKIDHGIYLQEFYSIKGQKRVMKSMILKEAERRRQYGEKLDERLTTYRKMLTAIRRFTGEGKTERIANKYYAQEVSNFSNFLYVLERIKGMEEMNDRLGMLQLDIEELRRVQMYRKDQQAETLEALEEELTKRTQSTQESEEELARTNQQLQELIKGVNELFKLCKCDREPLLKLLNDNTTIHDYNILLYLQVLENTIEEYLVRARYKDSDKKDTLLETLRPARIYTLSRIVKTDPCASCVVHELVSDVSDVMQHPMSRSETKRKLKLRLTLPGVGACLHRLSKCHLPQSRRLMQQRYE